MRRRAVGSDRPPVVMRPPLRAAEQLGQVADDDVGAVLAQRVGLPDPVHADHDPEVPGAAGLDAGQRVLEDRRGTGIRAELGGAREERVGVRLAGKLALAGHLAVDARVEQVREAGRPAAPRAVFALDETTAVRSPASRTACR